MARTDRSSSSLRPLALSQSVLSRADGSAKFSFGDVTVMASVTGPAEVKIREELVDRATLEVNVRPLRGQSGPASKAAEEQLVQLLTPFILLQRYPRSLIQLTLQTLSSPSTAYTRPFSTALEPDATTLMQQRRTKSVTRGVGVGASETAARINAAMLALVDAGVACSAMLISTAVALVPEHDDEPIASESSSRSQLLLDPTPDEESRATSTHVFVFAFGVGLGLGEGRGECVGADSVGKFNAQELFDAQDTAQVACQAVLAFVRRSIETRYGVNPPLDARDEKGAPLDGVKDEHEDEAMSP